MRAKADGNSEKENTVYAQIAMGYSSLVFGILIHNQITSKCMLRARIQKQNGDRETNNNNGKP